MPLDAVFRDHWGRVLATLIVLAIALVGLRTDAAGLDEIGRNRLPSVEGLMTVYQGQAAVRSIDHLIVSSWH